MNNYEDFFDLEQTKQHFEELRNNSILTLIDKFAEKHESAKKCGSEYIWQNDEAQVDAIKLVGKIFDIYAEDI